MKDDDKVRSTVTHVYVHPGDVFIGHDSTKDRLIRYAQKLSGTIKYSNFVHGGIIAGLGGGWLVHSNGRDESGAGTLSREWAGHLLDHKQYHIFRPKDQLFAEKIANVAHDMYNRTAIQDEAPAKFFFKGSIPPKTPDELRYEFQKYVEKDSDSTIHATKFVAFVIQYAAVELGVNYVDFLNIRHTKVVPSQLVEVLKHNLKFEEFKSQALVRHGGTTHVQQSH